jgi:hypothetical protein
MPYIEYIMGMYGVINKKDLIDEECPHDAIKDQA